MHLALVNKLKECKTSDKTKPCYHTFCIDIRKGIQIEPFYWWPTLRSTNIRLFRQIDFYSTYGKPENFSKKKTHFINRYTMWNYYPLKIK